MKNVKKCILSVMLLLFSSALFSQSLLQEWAPQSIENLVTAGTFTNEIDESFTPNADFGNYSQQFIYSGLGNPGKFDPVNPLPGVKTLLGYYRPGKIPFSLFGAFSGKAIEPANRPKGIILKTWDGPEHDKLLSLVKTTYNGIPAFSEYDAGIGLLTAVGSGKKLVTGLYFNVKGDNTEYVAAEHPKFAKTVTTDYDDSDNNKKENMYNTVAVGDPALGNYYNKTSGTIEFKNDFVIGVPLAFKTGEVSHGVKFELNGKVNNKNARYNKKDKDGEIKFKSTEYSSNINLGAGYGVEIPAKDREDDLWLVNAGMKLNFRNNESAHSFSNTQTNVIAKRKERNSPKLGFELEAGGGRLFVFPSPQKTVTFKIQPMATLKVDTGMSADSQDSMEGYNKKVTASFKDDTDTGTYKHTVKTGFHKNTTAFTTTFEAPMGLKIMPENWKVGLLMGATMSVSWNIEAEWDRTKKYRNKEKTVVIENGTTTVDNENKDYPASNYDAKTNITKNEFGFSEQHYLGLTIPFEKGYRLDVHVKGSNITLLDSFAIQAFIPLGVPKK